MICLLSGTNDWHIDTERGIFIPNIVLILLIMTNLFKIYLNAGFKVLNFDGSNRTSAIEIYSEIGSIKCGAPQGSCLGLLLFLIYINTLPFALKTAT